MRPSAFFKSVNCSFLLLAGMLVAGCGSTDRARLVGVWDAERAGSILGRLNIEPGKRGGKEGGAGRPDSADGFISPKMQIRFGGDGTLTTTTQMGSMTPKPKLGQWEFVSFDETTDRMKIKCTLGLQETEHEIEFLDVDMIKFAPPNMAGVSLKIKFKRQ